MTGSSAEALQAAEQLISELELGQISLANAYLKAARVARLLGDHDTVEAFGYEVGGYPSQPGGVEPRVFDLCRRMGRVSLTKGESGEVEKASLFSILSLEEGLAADKARLSVAVDPDVSIAYSNPNQLQFAPHGNFAEREKLTNSIKNGAALLSARRAFLYRWVLEKYYDLKFSRRAYSIFAATERDALLLLDELLPRATAQLSSALEGLDTDNPENWANAAHSCRRLLQDLADAVFPPDEDRMVEVEGKSKKVKLGSDQYINRLVAFIQDQMGSVSARAIVGSHLRFVGDRLDALFASSKRFACKP